jgi:hypothetical protein
MSRAGLEPRSRRINASRHATFGCCLQRARRRHANVDRTDRQNESGRLAGAVTNEPRRGAAKVVATTALVHGYRARR